MPGELSVRVLIIGFLRSAVVQYTLIIVDIQSMKALF